MRSVTRGRTWAQSGLAAEASSVARSAGNSVGSVRGVARPGRGAAVRREPVVGRSTRSNRSGSKGSCRAPVVDAGVRPRSPSRPPPPSGRSDRTAAAPRLATLPQPRLAKSRPDTSRRPLGPPPVVPRGSDRLPAPAGRPRPGGAPVPFLARDAPPAAPPRMLPARSPPARLRVPRLGLLRLSTARPRPPPLPAPRSVRVGPGADEPADAARPPVRRRSSPPRRGFPSRPSAPPLP